MPPLFGKWCSNFSYYMSLVLSLLWSYLDAAILIWLTLLKCSLASNILYKAYSKVSEQKARKNEVSITRDDWRGCMTIAPAACPLMPFTSKIPSHVPVVLQESVTLRDRYKNTWPVGARKVDGHWYLLDGWAKFVVDSSLTMMDVLDFHYTGPGSLDVHILDFNGDMKKGVGYRKIDNPKEHQNMEGDESKDSDECEVVCRENAKCKEEAEELRKSRNDKDASGSRKPQNESDKESSDKDCDSDYGPYDSYDEISEEDFVSEINGLEIAKKRKLKARDDKAPKSAERGSDKFDYLGNKFFESGVITRPAGKYFVTKMKPDGLHIPKDIVMDENFQLPKTIMLVDPNDYTYRSSLTSGTDGGRIYKKGWELLCSENKLIEKDFCICEFGERDAASFLTINIVRRARR